MNSYVLGFMFSEDRRFVALINKTHPDWQAGKLNGIGGCVRECELPIHSMVRKFEEETGCHTVQTQWRGVAALNGKNFIVHCFTASGDMATLRSTTEEAIEIKPVRGIGSYADRLVDSTAWLILLALDHLKDWRPDFVLVTYR
jgi:8-oxo-dGTP diphosphatase